MIAIKPVEGAEELRAFWCASGVAESLKCSAYEALERGRVLCYCLYRLEGDILTVHAVGGEEYDASLCDGLLRTVFYAGQQQGAITAHLTNDESSGYRRLLIEAGFPYKTTNDIDNILTNQKKCFDKR